jgi:hypothetical protein
MTGCSAGLRSCVAARSVAKWSSIAACSARYQASLAIKLSSAAATAAAVAWRYSLCSSSKKDSMQVQSGPSYLPSREGDGVRAATAEEPVAVGKEEVCEGNRLCRAMAAVISSSARQCSTVIPLDNLCICFGDSSLQLEGFKLRMKSLEGTEPNVSGSLLDSEGPQVRSVVAVR